MNIFRVIDEYQPIFPDSIIEKHIQKIKEQSVVPFNSMNLKKIFSMIDLTSLNTDDSEAKIVALCEKVNNFSKYYPSIPNVAAICVSPSLVAAVNRNLKNRDIKIASVAGGFPSSQTFLEVKIEETKIALQMGANEIDIVISVGDFLSGNLEKVYDEICAIKATTGEKHLKVILETGALRSSENIYRASILAMEAGADFIKTSTGKLNPAASLNAVLIMAYAVKEFHIKTTRKVGIKPAGGISTAKQAFEYYSIISHILKGEWLNSELFRFGASRLANDLLNRIIEMESGKTSDLSYF